MQKIFKTGAIFWEKAQCVCAVVKTKPLSIATPQLVEAMDQSETQTRSSAKYPAFSQGPICQV